MYGHPTHVDVYRILVALDKKVKALACRGNHADGGAAFRDLNAYLEAELTACAMRAAHSKKDSRARMRTAEKENTSEL